MALTNRERAIGAALALAAFVAIIAISPDTVWLVIGAGLATLMEFAALSRRRVPCAVLSFITGIGPWWDAFILFGAIYIVFGFLLVRAGRKLLDDSGGPRR